MLLYNALCPLLRGVLRSDDVSGPLRLVLLDRHEHSFLPGFLRFLLIDLVLNLDELLV